MSLSARPSISFVVATYNRGTVLIDCLRRTLACGLPQSQFDIRVVDNASTDDTPALLAAFTGEHGNVHHTRLQKNCGPVAKNIALHQNTADIIVFLDDDAYPQPGAVVQMIRHFQNDPHLGAAVFDVTLPNGAKEASAYPCVFIGAGTAIRGTALREMQSGSAARRPGRGLLPADFFMQAEEYDLSFRLIAAGWTVQRFWDMPLMHLKTPGARIGHRTTRLDVRNNLWLLARYVPEPLAQELAAEWLTRYWRMAELRDAARPNPAQDKSHKAAFLRGAAEGFSHWREQRGDGELILSNTSLEHIFKFDAIRTRLARLKDKMGITSIALGDWGKGILSFYRAAVDLGLRMTAIVDDRLAGHEVRYQGIPVIADSDFREHYQNHTDAVVLTTLSSVHASRRSEELERVLHVPVINLFSPLFPTTHAVSHGPPSRLSS
jgi:GT2 family glycosyltransferase